MGRSLNYSIIFLPCSTDEIPCLVYHLPFERELFNKKSRIAEYRIAVKEGGDVTYRWKNVQLLPQRNSETKNALGGYALLWGAPLLE